MIQLKVYKTLGDNDTALFLDLYDTEPIKLTLSIEDVTKADATSVFSKTFRVPATRNNNEFFENAYEVDGIDFDVTLKNQAQILVDGAEFREGHIRLQKIFRNQDLDRIDYELLFLGETRDFSSVIAERTMCQMVFSDFNWPGLPQNYTNAADFFGPFDYTDIVTSWNAFPENASLTGGYADGDILMPLIDHGNTYDENGAPQQGRIALGPTSSSSFTSNQAQWSLDQTRLKPMIRAKRVWDQIFEDASYTYSSTFLNSDQFHQMYISAFGNNEQIGMEIGQLTGINFESSNQFGSGNDITDYMWNNFASSNAANDFIIASPATGSYFTCPGTATAGGNYYVMSASAQMRAEIEQSSGPNISIPSFVRLCVVDFPGGTIQQTLATGNFTYNGNTSSLTWDSRNGGYQPIQGDTIQVFLDVQSSYVDYSTVTNTYWDCTAAPGDYYAPADLDCEYKQIEFVKDVLTMFRLVMQPDNTRPNNFIIEPWQDFIGSGTTYDWSHKLVEEQDMILEPLFNTQSATIEFSGAQDEDYINTFHQDNNKHAYGWLRFDSANELLKGTRKVEVKGIAATPIDQIEEGDANPNQLDPKFIIPSIHTHDDNTAANEHIPIKPKTRMLFYNGLQTITNSHDYWHLNNNIGSNVQQQKYPLVSPYENWPVQQTSLNLNFSNDTRYYINPSPGGGYYNQGTTLFDGFWSRYISSLYDKFSRRLTANFILNNVDLQYLTFDDVIFINGKYYRPEKILNAEVGAETKVQVQLITLNDQRPIWLDEPLTGFSVATSNTNCIGEQGNIQITTNGTPAFTWSVGTSESGNANPTGAAPYTFSITAPVGIDTLTVTDSLGRTATVQVDVPASTATPVTSTYTTVNTTICSDNISPQCNGSITVTGAGGSGAPYTIVYTDGNTSFNRTNLCEGTYQYIVYDANGCASNTYTVVLTCDYQSDHFVVRQHLGDCTKLGAIEYIVNYPNANLFVGDTCQLIEIGGCFQVMSTTTNVGVYTAFDPQPDCSSCIDHPHYSWQVESCITPGLFKYVAIGTPFDLVPGQVIDSVEFPDTCWTVIAQQNDQSIPIDMTFTQVYDDCASCASTTTFGYYAFACDTSSFPPTYFQSSGLSAQLTVGGVYKISTGTYTGVCVEIISLQQTPSGEFLNPFQYEDCDDCQGITPTPQVCHTVTATSTLTTFDYVLNNASYQLTLSNGQVAAICAEQGSVVISSGTGTIAISLSTCNSGLDCKIPPPPPDTYVIESCIPAMGNWTLLKGSSNFQIGDVVQFRLQGGLATYCGTIIQLNNGNPDAILHNEFNSYSCEDSIHCTQ